MGNSVIIQVRDLVARYGEDIILDGISFDVHRGEILVIVGGSGCGKSTLLKHMIGLNQPYSGKVLIEGEDITAVVSSLFKKKTTLKARVIWVRCLIFFLDTEVLTIHKREIRFRKPGRQKYPQVRG